MNYLDPFDDVQLEQLMFHSTSLADLPPITDTVMGDPKAIVGIILQHGFIGSNLELLYLANHLVKQEFRVLIPILPGHGTNFKDLNGTDHHDWQASLERAIEFLLDEQPNRQIYIIAHSMGGCLALLSSLKYPQIKFVSTLATPLNYPLPVHFLAKLVNRIKPDLFIKYRDFKFHDKRLAGHPYVHYLRQNYGLVSAKTLNDVIDLLELTERHLKEVTVPLLVFYPRLDRTVWFTSSWKIYSRVRSTKKAFVSLYRSNHIVPAETDKNIVVQKILDFIHRINSETP